MRMKRNVVVLLACLIILTYQACEDYGSQPPPPPPPPPIVAVPNSVSILPGDTSRITLQSGARPYAITRAPNSSIAAATISDSTLRVIGVSAGSTDVEVGDNSTPQNKLTIPITVASLVSFIRDIQPIFNSNGCVSCHGGSGGLFLTQGQSYDNLVNVQAQAGCTNLKRVLPFKADSSVLYIRTSSQTSDAQCGPNSRMPQGGNRLPQATIDLIRNWINQGARNN